VGNGADADFSYEISQNGKKISLTLRLGDQTLHIPLSVYGKHNAENAAMAASAALTLGISPTDVATALSEFKAIPRRLQYLGECRGAGVFYDYAHHPKEIEATLLTTASMGYEKTAVLFCPHTYTRTKSLWEDFAKSLAAATWAFITEIFPAREKAIPGITGERLAKAVSEAGGKGEFFSKASPTITPIFDLGADSIVLMGAGDFGDIYKKFIEAIDKERGLC
jgi:UDP-N-acetylmuramate--alanine ligase